MGAGERAKAKETPDREEPSRHDSMHAYVTDEVAERFLERLLLLPVTRPARGERGVRDIETFRIAKERER